MQNQDKEAAGYRVFAARSQWSHASILEAAADTMSIISRPEGGLHCPPPHPHLCIALFALRDIIQGKEGQREGEKQERPSVFSKETESSESLLRLEATMIPNTGKLKVKIFLSFPVC